jgi:hypothetical protein
MSRVSMAPFKGAEPCNSLLTVNKDEPSWLRGDVWHVTKKEGKEECKMAQVSLGNGVWRVTVQNDVYTIVEEYNPSNSDHQKTVCGKDVTSDYCALILSGILVVAIIATIPAWLPFMVIGWLTEKCFQSNPNSITKKG